MPPRNSTTMIFAVSSGASMLPTEHCRLPSILGPENRLAQEGLTSVWQCAGVVL